MSEEASRRHRNLTGGTCVPLPMMKDSLLEELRRCTKKVSSWSEVAVTIAVKQRRLHAYYVLRDHGGLGSRTTDPEHEGGSGPGRHGQDGVSTIVKALGYEILPKSANEKYY